MCPDPWVLFRTGAALSTCVFAGEFGLRVAHPLRALAVFLVAAVLAVLVSVTPPAFRYAGPICDAVEFLCAAFNHRWQHWNRSYTHTHTRIYCFTDLQNIVKTQRCRPEILRLTVTPESYYLFSLYIYFTVCRWLVLVLSTDSVTVPVSSRG